MSWHYRRFHCKRCEGTRIFKKATVRHSLHLALSVVTGGLWLVSWASLVIGNVVEPWICCKCHARQAAPKDVDTDKPENPGLQEGDLFGLARRGVEVLASLFQASKGKSAA
jgi:hypothetical protein